MAVAKQAWLVEFDRDVRVVVYGDDLWDVLSFIGSNELALFGHDNMGHINIQIDKVTDDDALMVNSYMPSDALRLGQQEEDIKKLQEIVAVQKRLDVGRPFFTEDDLEDEDFAAAVGNNPDNPFNL